MGGLQMDLSAPARCVVPSLAADVLVVLARTDRPMTGRQIHRLTTGASWSGVRRVLADLADTGLVDVTEAGPANLYVLNRDHIGAEAVLALVDLRGRLLARIRAAIKCWEVAPLSAIVFGSAARGDGDRASDVDILLIRPRAVSADDPEWAAAVADLCTSIRRWSGNPGSVIDVDPVELDDMVTRGEPIVAELLRDQVVLVGDRVFGSLRQPRPE
jgi:predicted nucleotidyltransferase